MPAAADKPRVRESFDRAATAYDHSAQVQRRVCHRLLECLAAPIGAPSRALDAGCGTGYGVNLLRQCWPDALVIGTDFSSAMLARARQATPHCFLSDIESLPLADGSLDLWWSNFTLQWCDNARAFGEAKRALKPGGWLVFSTLAPRTFVEIQTAFSGVDRYRHTLRFNDQSVVEAALKDAGFGDVALLAETQTLYYPDLVSLLKSIKAVGAHHVGRGARAGMMGRAAFLRVKAAYESFRTAEGLPLTYDVILCRARS